MLADVLDVDDRHAPVPQARPEFVPIAQRVVQPGPAPGPGGGFAAGGVLPGYPPARDFLGPAGVAYIVDDQDVADVAGHFGRNIGVVLVHVEAVHAYAAGLLVDQQAGPGLVRDVVDLEAAAVVGPALGLLDLGNVGRVHVQGLGQFRMGRVPAQRFAQPRAQAGKLVRLASDAGHVAFVVDDHDVAHHARLVGVRFRIVQVDLADDHRLARIRDVDNGSSQLRLVRNMADIRMVAGHAHLACARQLHAGEAGNVLREWYRV